LEPHTKLLVLIYISFKNEPNQGHERIKFLASASESTKQTYETQKQNKEQSKPRK
jgi:hypothetical protein